MRKFNYLKYENYKWDSEIVRKISSIHNNKGKLEVLISQKFDDFDKLIVHSKFESIVASNIIEGIVTTNNRYKQLINEKVVPKNRSEQEISGYKDAFDLINESYQYIEITPNHILQLHGIMYKKVTDKSIGGQYKNSQNYVSSVDEKGNVFTIFTPLDPFETRIAMDELCKEYNQAIERKTVDPLILSFIFILDFLAIHPFTDGNGRTSRLLTNLLLYRLGFYVGKYISIENKIAKTKELYYDSLYESQQNWHSDGNDPTPFISYMLGIIEMAYNDLEERIALSKQNLSAYDLVKQTLSKQIGKITKSEVINLCPTLSSSSVEKSIAQLVDEGKLEKHGSGRNTFYVIKI